MRNIRKLRRKEETQRNTRPLKAMIALHQALRGATQEGKLLSEACRIVVEEGGYHLAWVGYAEEAQQLIRPMAQEGFEPEFLAPGHLIRVEGEPGCSPAQQAILTGKPVIVRSTQIEAWGPCLTADAQRRGYASVLALPLKSINKGIKTFGALSIYAVLADAFDADEVSLLTGFADDLACGISRLRGRTGRRQAVKALKESEKEFRLITARLLDLQEAERRRVARELHDELGQALTVLKIHLVGIEEDLSADQHQARDSCEHMLSYIDTVIEQVRRLAWDLSPSCLEDLGLSASLGYLVEEICRNNNLASSVVMDEIDHLFAPETKINIYRIFQEALANIANHARARRVTVSAARQHGKVLFVIQDDGQGFNLMEVMADKVGKRSLGLTAMHERALMTQGSLQVSSRKDLGTTITFSIPTAKAEE
jgi:signal transduction histidine kinase